jgi:hypothetical protein
MCETSLVRPEGMVQIKVEMTLRLACWVLLSAAAIGCGSDSGSSSGDDPVPPGGQTGEETVGCLPVERDMLAWSERSTLGFSADELLNALGSEREGRLRWANGNITPLTLTLARTSGSVEFQQREWTTDASGRELANTGACNDVVAVPVTLGFTTSDGAFAERWQLTLLAESRAAGGAFLRIDLDSIEGSFVVTQVDPDDFDEVLASLTLSFDEDGWSGTLSGQGVTTGSTPGGSSSATQFAIATF